MESSDTIPPREVEVALGDKSYRILIAPRGVDRLAEFLGETMPGMDRLGIVASEAVNRLHGDRVRDALRELSIPIHWVVLSDGEQHKNLRTVSSIFDALLPKGMTRQSGMLALGGGVVGDVAGYAAASLLRGIRYVQVPTTLLAMVDSSVGGKTGVNHSAGKNLIGAFHQPCGVLIDSVFLRTLPPEEFRAGFAEVIKYGVIRDVEFFKFLESNVAAIFDRREGPLLRAIECSVAIKAEVVSQDEREEGLRAILNFGHTVGHALEAATSYRQYRHGEAVAIGMVSAARLAERVGLLKESRAVSRLEKLCIDGMLPVRLPQMEVESLLAPMAKDKKVRDGRLRFVLPERIGHVRIVNDIPEEEIRKTLKEAMALA